MGLDDISAAHVRIAPLVGQQEGILGHEAEVRVQAEDESHVDSSYLTELLNGKTHRVVLAILVVEAVAALRVTKLLGNDSYLPEET